jgi:multisubunit Na+/H+ antiporter MnhB subunit
VKILRNSVLALSLTAFAAHAIELNPGYPENIHTDEKEESPLRRGEIIFFISYPFTFLASFAAYGVFGYGMYAAEGKSNFAPDGAFYGLAAVTAAILSFGIAMDDHYAIKAQTKDSDGKTSGYLSLSFRF